jgi:outer membrane usher protein
LSRTAVFAGLLLALTMTAAPSISAAQRDGESAHIIDLVLNGGESRTLIVYGKPGERTLIDAEDWRTLRLREPPRGATPCGENSCFALEDLPGLEARFTPASQRLSASLPPSAFEATRREHAPRQSADAAATPGLLLNYHLNADRSNAHENAAALIDMSRFDQTGTVRNSGVWRWQGDASRFVRLESRWEREWPEDMTRLTVGDAVADPGSAGAPLRMAGVVWGTEFELRPDYITTPLLSASGSAVLPSVVDVFIGQRRVARETVQPGPFLIEQLPPSIGAGELSVVVNDALGQQTEITQPFYAAPRLLRTGTTERSVAFGTLREGFGVRSFDYGDVMASGRWRRGLNDSVTLGFGVAATASSGSAVGTALDLRAGMVASLRLETALSRHRIGVGVRHAVTIERRSGRFSTAASLQQWNARYRDPGHEPLLTTARPHQRATVSAGVQVGHFGSVSLTALRQSFHDDAAAFHSFRLGYSLAHRPVGHLFVRAQLDDRWSGGWGIVTGWTRSLGERRSAAVTLRHGTPGGQGHTMRMRRALPRGTGMGYDVELEQEGGYLARMSGRNDRTRWNVEAGRRNSHRGLRASTSGSVLHLGGHWRLGRPVYGGFAMVDLEGLPDVTIYAENQPVAVTNAQGVAVVTDLRAYQQNRLSIDPTQLPLSVHIDSPRTTVTPRAGAGVRVEFPMRRVRHASLRLRLDEARPVPAGAVIEPETLARPVGHAGRAYLEEVPPGTTLEAHWPGGRCRFELGPYDDGPDSVTEMGEISCQAF